VRTVGKGARVAWIVAYCEVDLPVGTRHRLEDMASVAHGVRLIVFDGEAIAELLAMHAEAMRPAIDAYLHVDVDWRAPVAPRELPRRPLRFTNRNVELAALDLVSERASLEGGTQVVVLEGMHGVGKSAFGSEWAHRNRLSFSGGALFGDLSSHGDGAHVDVSETLAGFLQDLGLPRESIPPRRWKR
jgi:hypothetical protein